MVALLTLTILPVQSYAAPKSDGVTVPANKTNDNNSAEASALIVRLDEIKAMDMSNLKSKDKRALHKEVRSINKRLKAISGGVYISAGTLIVILILLILLT